MKLSGPGLLFLGKFFITDSISVPVLSLSRLLISSWLRFERLYISRNLSICSNMSSLLVCNCLLYALTNTTLFAVFVSL